MSIAELSAVQVLHYLQSGELLLETYMASLLAQQARSQHLNALIAHTDAETALALARQFDLARRKGKTLPALAGLPLLVKDNIDVLGFATTAGTPGLKSNHPQAHAPIVQRLVDQGAFVLAKTNMHELAAGGTSSNQAFGAVGNPYDLQRVAGGSSGGTAAAIAAHMGPVGLGTDTSGSVRIPASFCGVAALRPTSRTPKLYPDAGLVPLSAQLDTVGPMARTVADLALLHTAITGQSVSSPPSLQGLKLARVISPFWNDLQPELANCCNAAILALQDAGAVIIDLELDDLATAAATIQREILFSSARQDLGHYLQARHPSLSLEGVLAQLAGRDVGRLYELAQAPAHNTTPDTVQLRRAALHQQLNNLMQQQGVAALLYPTEPIVAPLIRPAGDTMEDELLLNGRLVSAGQTITRNTRFASGLGIPALSVPVGLTASGLPVGLELASRWDTDARLLALGMAIEAVVPQHLAPRPT